MRIGIGRLAVPPQLNLRIDRRLTNHVFFPYIKIPVVIVTGRGSTCEVYFHLKGAHRNPCLCSLISNGVSMCQSKGIPLSEFLENRQQFRNSHIVSRCPQPLTPGIYEAEVAHIVDFAEAIDCCCVKDVGAAFLRTAARAPCVMTPYTFALRIESDGKAVRHQVRIESGWEYPKEFPHISKSVSKALHAGNAL